MADPDLPSVRLVLVDQLDVVVPQVLVGATKVVALVGYHDDAEASLVARHLPYGIDGRGVEEIVFARVGPPTGDVVRFDDDAWPGEDRTFVQDDLDAAIELVMGFATERGAGGAVVLVTGRPPFLHDLADKLGPC